MIRVVVISVFLCDRRNGFYESCDYFSFPWTNVLAMVEEWKRLRQ